MRVFRGLFPLILFELLFGLSSFCFAAKKPIRFSPLPLMSEEVVSEHFRPFVSYLSDVTETEIEQVYFKNYQVLIEGLADNQIDLAFLGPLPYVMLKRRMPDVVPLARFLDADGKATYTCALASFTDEIDLQEVSFAKPIAIPQPYSTCAYLMTENFLRKRRESLKKHPFYYAGNHEESALDVVRGKASLAGLKTEIGQVYSKLGLHLFEQQTPLPRLLLVANPRTLSAEQISLIKSKILELDPLHNPDHRQVTASWGYEIRYGAIPVEEGDYRYIEELLSEIEIPGVWQ